MDIYFYYIADDYIEFLKSVEKANRGYTCVPNVNYGISQKFTYGTVMQVNGMNYFVPVSSYNKPQQDLILLRDKKDRSILGSLRFNYMIPVPLQCIQKVDINALDVNKRVRTSKELAFCRRTREKISKTASATYNRVVNGIDSELLKNSCDFKLLEDAYIIYCHDNCLVLPDVLEERYIELEISKNLSESSLSDNSSPTEITGKPFTITHSQMKKNAANISSNNTRQDVPKKDKKQTI